MENLYVVCLKSDFDSKYKDYSSGGENYSLDKTKVQFSNRFTGTQIKTLANNPGVEIYNETEISIVLSSAEWRELPPKKVIVDNKFKEDYAKAVDKLDFLEMALGLK